MTQVSDDFKRYLEANYPDDLLKISSPDVKDDVITSVCSRHDKTYLVWKMVPEWIKSLYCDRLPAEVFSGHEPWDKFIFNIEQSVMNQIPYDRTKLTAFVYDSIIRDPENCHAVGEKMEKGYSFETSANLQYNKILRSNLIKSDKLKTDEGKKQWRKIRESDRKLIIEDWKEFQPEKYVFNQIKSYNRANINKQRAKNKDEEIKYAIAKAKADKEFKEYIDKVEDSTLRQKLYTLMEQVKKNIEKQQKKNMERNIEETIAKVSNKRAAKNISQSGLKRAINAWELDS